MLPLQPGLRVAGRYRLVDQLGVGGMSEVWRADDEVLGRPVAVKLLASSLADDSLRGLIFQEARAMAKLSHPNVTSVFDYGEFTIEGESLPYVVMELLRGQTLGRVLVGGALPWTEAVLVTAQVAAALAAAHRHGLVHCDVTPANVMLTDGGVKVLDFGVTAVLGGSRDGQPRFGTPGYIAPERLSTGVPVTPAVDVFALGALLYACLVGQPPTSAQDPLEAAAKVVADKAPLQAVSGLPADVMDVCLRCLAERPADRPSSAEVARILAGVVPGVHIGRSLLATGAAAAPRTMPMPAPTIDVETAPLRAIDVHSVRWLWPALVGTAIAGLVLVVVSAYLVGIGRQQQPDARPNAQATSSVAPTQPGQTEVTPALTLPEGLASVARLGELVIAGRVAGEIRADCAEDLLSDIVDLQRRISRGQEDNARHRIEQIGEEIDDRVADGDITAQRGETLQAALDVIVV